MKKGSAYRFMWPYKLINSDVYKEDSSENEAPNGSETCLLPATRHESEAGIPPSEASDHLNIKTEYDGSQVTTTLLVPLSELPKAPQSPKKKVKEKKYIGDDVFTSFLQDPLTTILY